MGPTRSSSSSHNKAKKGSESRGTDRSASLPGVQKIKALLRQTRRLLAKDSLAADVRVETERRLKSLEADLAKAERTRTERGLAVKYHKVKFFERQKVCRKIKHTKKLLDAPDSPPESLSALRETLFSHRVDLNYILHYPKTKKYVSLFPPESADAGTDAPGRAQTDRQREELRQWVRAAMEKGEMDLEPEERMDKRGNVRGEGMDWEEDAHPATSPGNKGKQKDIAPSKVKGVPRDAFFEGSDDGSDVESDGG